MPLLIIKKFRAGVGVLRVTSFNHGDKCTATVSRVSRRKLIMLNYTLGNMAIVFQCVIDSAVSSTELLTNWCDDTEQLQKLMFVTNSARIMMAKIFDRP